MHLIVRQGLWSAILFLAACAAEPLTATSAVLERGATSLDPPDPGGSEPSDLGRSTAVAALAGRVGFYDMFGGTGESYQVPPITKAGGMPIPIDDPSAAALDNVDVLWVHNPNNDGFGSEYVSRLAEIDAAVQNGMILVIHDRAVSGAAGILPGGNGFAIFRDGTEGADINVRDASTVVTADLTNTSLDGGTASNHGFTLESSLPARARLILTATTPSHIVTFCYPHGRGAVIYSSIPLDFYLQGGNSGTSVQDAMTNVYAPNVVKYAIAGACKTRGPRPTPNVAN